MQCLSTSCETIRITCVCSSCLEGKGAEMTLQKEGFCCPWRQHCRMMLEANAIQIAREALGEVAPPKTTQANGTPHGSLPPCLPSR